MNLITPRPRLQGNTNRASVTNPPIPYLDNSSCAIHTLLNSLNIPSRRCRAIGTCTRILHVLKIKLTPVNSTKPRPLLVTPPFISSNRHVSSKVRSWYRVVSTHAPQTTSATSWSIPELPGDIDDAVQGDLNMLRGCDRSAR
jgi:hypothetical protein